MSLNQDDEELIITEANVMNLTKSEYCEFLINLGRKFIKFITGDNNDAIEEQAQMNAYYHQFKIGKKPQLNIIELSKKNERGET